MRSFLMVNFVAHLRIFDTATRKIYSFAAATSRLRMRSFGLCSNYLKEIFPLSNVPRTLADRISSALDPVVPTERELNVFSTPKTNLNHCGNECTSSEADHPHARGAPGEPSRSGAPSVCDDMPAEQAKNVAEG